MTQFWKAMLLAMICALVPGAAMPQGACLEGRTASGQCVNEVLATQGIQDAVIYSQHGLSKIQYPILPSEDWTHPKLKRLSPSLSGTPAIMPHP